VHWGDVGTEGGQIGSAQLADGMVAGDAAAEHIAVLDLPVAEGPP
jgi:hypothetical protein